MKIEQLLRPCQGCSAQLNKAETAGLELSSLVASKYHAHSATFGTIRMNTPVYVLFRDNSWAFCSEKLNF
jgi:hypothetical protein